MPMIIKLDESHISALVNIHSLSFQDFFLTRLGPAFLKKYYSMILNYHGGVILGIHNDTELMGFVCGFRCPPEFYREMKRQRIKLLFPVVRGLMRRPHLMSRLLFNIKSVSGSRSKSLDDNAVYELSSIGVNPDYSGMGYGKDLVSAFIDYCAKNNGKTISLSTDANDNDAVNAFYISLGFSLNKQYNSGSKRLMNEYVLTIEPN